MKFMVQVPVETEAAGGAWLDPDNIAAFARAAEESGIDAISLTDHPAPSKKWLDTGGHETYDPFVGLTFCAANTSTVQLMTHLVVVPYRNPLLMARSMTSVDRLSRGRTIWTLGTGYLRSEFSALGVDFSERNELFEEAIEVLKGVWSTDDFHYEGRHFRALGVILKPGPVQRPHPPLWFGGNAKVVRERVARSGDGWAPMTSGGEILARTARTAAITSDEQFADLVRDLGRRLEEHGRTLADVDVCAMSQRAHYTPGSPGQFLDAIGELAEIGVTWTAGHTGRHDSVDATIDGMRQFGEEVIARAR